MFSFFRKSRFQTEETWNEAKFEYEEAILRCYKWRGVTLALCGFGRFSAFNFIDSPLVERKREAFVDSDFKLWGVVHEESRTSRHVRCEVDIVPTTNFEEPLGVLSLTHLLTEEKKPHEARAMHLHVNLHDHTSMLRTTLIDGLRDAALSGLRFMHIALECPEPTTEQCEKAVADMRSLDYATHRQILSVKMWPKLELQNAPGWARLPAEN
jgi:hypothetical protein